jgi:signal transduction histidine kinase
VSHIIQREPLSLSGTRSPPFEAVEPDKLQVEVGAIQSVLINDQEILLFRRIIINQQVYRQGFVLLVRELLRYLREAYFPGQPMAEFANLRLEITNQGRRIAVTQTGVFIQTPHVAFQRTFPAPFSFLEATISCKQLPGSIGRRNLNLMRILIGAIILSGLFAIYYGTRTVVQLSERRARFASSVTHELKTPLTNIQMYAEMLEQGIAPNREREQEYFHILRSESKRLSRLIDNVLEFSKLTKKQRHFHLQEGTFDEVIQEVQEIIQPTIRRQGFTFTIEKDTIPLFKYDREVMVQILLNLIENSIKFGKTSPARDITLRIHARDGQISISVSDTGPGIPCAELSRVFDDFYRVDNELGRATRGTGLGLSLVKQFVTALGGRVKAANNAGQGCTITISLPMGRLRDNHV